jgi:hypothetical protein
MMAMLPHSKTTRKPIRIPGILNVRGLAEPPVRSSVCWVLLYHVGRPPVNGLQPGPSITALSMVP